MGVEATKTIQTRLHIASGDRSWLHDARLAARDIYNETLRLKQAGYSRTEIQREVDRADFLRNNKCAVVRKALQAWTSYQSLVEWWRSQDNPDGGKPSRPSTEKTGSYPLVMAYTEGYVALTALNRASRQTKVTLVIDYSHVKAERQRYHTITKRCQEHGKERIHRKLGNREERFSEWILHRLSRAVVEFVNLFQDPVIVFEDLGGIREGMQYGSYMNRRLHKLPFHKFEEFVSYKATWREIPTDSVDAYYNSQTCSCCGARGTRRGQRFTCSNDSCQLVQDHADRNASVNIVWREISKLDGIDSNYRTHKTQPQVRVVRLSGSGRVSRPAASHSIAEQGVLMDCGK